jgi:hypothetical protein
VIDGYSTILWEIDDELARLGEAGPDLVAVQIGVGALAAAVTRYYRRSEVTPRPRLVGVEPSDAACVLASVAAGVPVAVLRMAKLPGGATSASVTSGRRMHNARMGEGARRQEAVFRNGSATFRYAGRDYTLALDITGKHSIAPGLYRYENGVHTALLEYGGSDDQYLLLRVTVPEAGESSNVVPYLVLNGRIVPPIDVSVCSVNVEKVERAGTAGGVDCGEVERSVLRSLSFSAH